MESEILKVITQGATDYFAQVGGQPALTHPAYLENPKATPVDDFSALIGISGRYRGCVYFTAPRELLTPLLERLGERTLEDSLYADLAGEISNTIAGNARRQLGAGFMISVPILLKGRPDELQFPRGVDCFVVPIEWCGQRARLVFAIRQEDAA
jgi:chemotaxis protein CheX